MLYLEIRAFGGLQNTSVSSQMMVVGPLQHYTPGLDVLVDDTVFDHRINSHNAVGVGGVVQSLW